MPWFECPVTGCPEVSRKKGRCAVHGKQQGKEQQANRHTNKRYNRARWINTRNAYKTKNPLCEICLAKGKTKVADLVHHIVPVIDGGDWYRFDNLMAVCVKCHGILHTEVNVDEDKT